MAQNIGNRIIDGERAPAGFEKLAVSSVAVAGAVPDDCSAVLISVELGAVRWRDDGIDPTTSVGNPLPEGAIWLYTGDPARLAFIRQSGDAVVNLNYYR